MTLEILTSDLLASARHGFFTRRGGASSGVFAGLNCGPGSSDQSSMVTINRTRAAEAMGLTPDRLCSLAQVHSDRVITVTEPFATRPEADAMVTDREGLALGVLSADCAPVLFSAPGVVGAAHSGWKGAIGGVLEATVAAMEQLGAARREIRAAVGPCISQRAYEVGPEFLDTFLAEDPAYARHFANGTGDRMLFDLPGFVLGRLRAMGLEAEWTGHCTYSDPGRFFSFRRTTHAGEADYGRLISIIRL
ncbi:peptidoglycan editing factor PgeF [Oceanicella sp. SM1341]|uniref:peptidoglycan editing factor PgeF n=1 Tax=Oceanicella sp. SM1341 TaxID=1548889 RepID=UPI000E498FC6|nr:peptidoglycan editing factor PgeF [Oceanicella sp. SM1341]